MSELAPHNETFPSILLAAPAPCALDSLERLILDHNPRTSIEAVGMLNVIISDVAAGGRCDGRDVRALQAIQTLLEAMAQSRTATAASATFAATLNQWSGLSALEMIDDPTPELGMAG